MSETAVSETRISYPEWRVKCPSCDFAEACATEEIAERVSKRSGNRHHGALIVEARLVTVTDWGPVDDA